MNPPSTAAKTVLYVEDLARIYEVSPKVIRNKAGKGELPAPFKRGRRLAWTSEGIREWISDRAREARESPPQVQVTITTYRYKDTTGLQAIWSMQCPTDTSRERPAREAL